MKLIVKDKSTGKELVDGDYILLDGEIWKVEFGSSNMWNDSCNHLYNGEAWLVENVTVEFEP